MEVRINLILITLNLFNFRVLLLHSKFNVSLERKRVAKPKRKFVFRFDIFIMLFIQRFFFSRFLFFHSSLVYFILHYGRLIFYLSFTVYVCRCY